MSRLNWGTTGERFFEAGADRGVLYPKEGPGVAWNGLTTVSEEASGGEAVPYYFDGIKYLNVSAAEEFTASLEAFSSPPEFAACDGTQALHKGLFATQQPRKSFGLAYRTRIGNDVDGLEHGYKLHLIYDALASPSSRSNQTIGDSIELTTLSWEITATPFHIPGIKPTAHLVIDSTKSDLNMLAVLEGYLYGANGIEPRLPSPSEVVALFREWPFLDIQTPVNFLGRASSSTQSVTNYYKNPSFESRTGTVEVYRNLINNPSSEATSGIVEVRRNHVQNPRGTSTNGLLGFALTPQWYGSGGVGTTSYVTAASDGPEVDGIKFDTYGRKTWTTVGGNGSLISWQLTAGTPRPVGTVGSTFTASLYWRNSSGAGLSDNKMTAEFYDAPSGGNRIGAVLVGALYPTPAAGQWQRVSGTFVVPAGATHVQFYHRVDMNAASLSVGMTLDATAAMVEVSSVLGQYFDHVTPIRLRRNRALWPLPTETRWVANWGTGGAGAQAIYPNGGPDDVAFAAMSWTAAATGNTRMLITGVGASGIPVTPGEALSLSVDVAGSKALAITWDWYNGATWLSSGTGLRPEVSSSIATPTRLTATTGAAPANATHLCVFVHMNTPGIGSFIRATRLLVGDDGAYFDGSSPLAAWVGLAFDSASFINDPDLTPSATGTPNASPSILTAIQVTGVRQQGAGVYFSSTLWAASGTRSQRVLRVGSGDTFAEVTVSLVAGKTYTLMATSRVAQPITLYGATSIQELGAGYRIPATLVPSGTILEGVQEWRVSFTLNSDWLSSSRINLRTGVNVGDNVWWDKLALVEGIYTGPYFDGTTPIVDFESVFVGTPHNSPSTLTAQKATDVGAHPSNGSKTYQSSKWSSRGSKSICITSAIQTAASFDTFAEMYSSNLPPMVPGNTYTVIATVHSEAPWVSTDGRARRIVVTINTASGAKSFYSNALSRDPGTYEARVVFTAPTDATSWMLFRLYNGVANGGPEVWWDDIATIEGNYTGPAFHGANPESFVYLGQEVLPVWNGPVDNSTSRINYYTSLPEVANPGDAWLINAELWVYQEYWKNYGDIPVSI